MEDKESKAQNLSTKVHPKIRAGFLSNIFFCWAFPMFVKGYKRTLNEEDLYEHLKSHDSQKLGDTLEKNWVYELKKSKKPSLSKVLVRTYIKEFLPYVGLLFIQELGLKMAQPFLIGGLMAYYNPQQTDITLGQAYYYACGIIVLTVINAWILHFSFFGLSHLAMKARLSCCSLIYRKALKLSRAALAESTIGNMVTLMSNDVARFQYLMLHFHHMVVTPIQTLFVLYLLYTTVDPTAMAGVALLLTFIPFQMFMGRLTMYYRSRTAKRSDQRIRLMNEIVSGIQVIKMYTWEVPFSKLVQLARKLEIKEIQSNAFLRGINSALTMFLIRTSMYLCILVYVLTGHHLKAEYVYVVQSFYGALRQPLTVHMPRCFAMLAETMVALNRVQEFLQREEVQVKELPNNKIGIKMQRVCIKWQKDSVDSILSSIDFEAAPRELIAIVGPVGSGKTSLLQTILQEVNLTSGQMDVNGRISYAAQEPWLFSASIRQNITFGEPMDTVRYNKVVEVCQLERDINLMTYGDRTIVGERGIMLSGGQKARVNLARAIYKQADVYLLDDPLSAVDAHVGKELFNEAIVKFLADKITILVTHQIQHLFNVNRIYLLENGKITANGTYEELQKSEIDFLKLFNEEAQEIVVDDDEVKVTEKKEIKELSNGLPKEVKEQRSTGSLKKSVYLKYFEAGGSCFVPFLLVALFMAAQSFASGTDYFLSFWVNREQDRFEQKVSNSTYEETFFTSNNCLYIYSVLLAIFIVFTFIRSFSFVIYSMIIAKNLHNTMFEQLIKATMRFFHTNASGRILNRFSKDIGNLDELLPTSFTDTLQLSLNVFGISVLISVINPWIAIPTVVTFAIFYFYKTVFLATSLDLKRLESTSRSPIYSHLSQSLQGLSTIRALRAETILQKEFDQHQNFHSSAFYLFMGCTRTFAFWLDMNATIYIGLVILSFLFIGTETYGANVGLAITQAITLTGQLQRGIRQWSELENQMTSVERVLEYTDLPREPNEGKKEPPREWPSKGAIIFQDVYLKYAKNLPYVLKSLSFEIIPGEKVGIVGRTGAGKSSLIAAIFRLALNEGTITIDGVNIDEVSLKSLRSIISIIPQEPVLFSGTLRKNLDPFDEYSDTSLWAALEEVELKKHVSELPAGLTSTVTENGSNFSVGQRQLLCLARAIVRDNRILILDEATANVDPQTDELIQETIRRTFKACTVLTIAHRLNTVMDSDRIMVVDGGECVEFDHPFRLLLNQEGIFAGLVRETGEAQAVALQKIAEENYLSRD